MNVDEPEVAVVVDCEEVADELLVVEAVVELVPDPAAPATEPEVVT